ncbi:MAG: arginine deiminase family protein [Oscillospiraceae bacterium]|nr:arginine deiminase family protein [Oscillospiraceae bacterium]
MFKNVIVKTPCKAISEGISSNPELGKPDYEKALVQHAAYIKALESCGVQVTVLPADEAFPDSCFVEDTAVLTERCAIISNPGAESRKGETAAMLPCIEQFYDKGAIEFIKAPGTLEGGDVMMIGETLYVGLSARTNAEGIEQFSKILEKYGYKCVAVPLEKVLHLKTGVNYLGGRDLLVSGEFIDKSEFESFNKITVPESEAYAANCIRVNSAVIAPEGYEGVKKAVEAAGYKVITVDTSEFRKIDGGLSCLSLRF